jgi:hypothetical protein
MGIVIFALLKHFSSGILYVYVGIYLNSILKLFLGIKGGRGSYNNNKEE